MATTTSPLNSTTNPTLQQAGAARASNVMGLGRRVRLTNEAYTVGPDDGLIIVAASTSSGNWTLTFPTGSAAAAIPDGKVVGVILPAALGGTSAYVTSGVTGGPYTFDAIGDSAEFVWLATEGVWRTLSNNIA